MEKIILYVDDAVYAREHLAKLAPGVPVALNAESASSVPGAVGTDTRATFEPRHWIVVACAPRMTHRISKWVSHSARENWRGKWFGKVQAQLVPLLEAAGDQVTPMLASGSLTELTQQLRRDHGTATVVDARRPKVGVDLEPVAPGQTPPAAPGWALPGAVVGMGALLVIAGELSE
ncbi:MAG: hypothetical protein JWQ73_2839 [Variovorax sp.]|nr:hypothetical protein [Variovorax sp.]